MALSETVLKVREASDLVSLWKHSLTYLRAIGTQRLSYHLTSPLLQLGAHAPLPRLYSWNFPDSWMHTYSDKEYGLINPISELALRRGTPFWWQDISSDADLNDSQRAFLQDLSGQEFGNGLAMGVFGPFLRNGCVILYVSDQGRSAASLNLAEVHTVMQAAHFRYCELTVGDVPDFGRLSHRERQVLQCLALGKSKGVIADLLEVSRHTVDTLVRRLFGKFGVSDRTSAVLVGVAMGSVQTASNRYVTRLRD